jgi:hypothetical protein
MSNMRVSMYKYCALHYSSQSIRKQDCQMVSCSTLIRASHTHMCTYVAGHTRVSSAIFIRPFVCMLAHMCERVHVRKLLEFTPSHALMPIYIYDVIFVPDLKARVNLARNLHL